MKKTKRLVAGVLSTMMLMSCTGTALAAAPSEAMLYDLQPVVVVEDNCTVSTFHTEVKGCAVSAEFRTYDNGVTVVTAEENGKVTTFTLEPKKDGKRENEIMVTSTPDDYLDYRFLVTKTYYEYAGPEYADWADALDWASGILWDSADEENDSDMWGVVTWLASLVCNASAAEKPTYITKIVDYYEVFDAAGVYLGYYYMDYDITVRVEGSRPTTKHGGTYSTMVY